MMIAGMCLLENDLMTLVLDSNIPTTFLKLDAAQISQCGADSRFQKSGAYSGKSGRMECQPD